MLQLLTLIHLHCKYQRREGGKEGRREGWKEWGTFLIFLGGECTDGEGEGEREGERVG
jgi:hypothetical protein